MVLWQPHSTQFDMWNVLIMVLIALFAVAAIGMLIIEGHRKYITEHWVEYRCKPYIMPFAAMFGKDTISNFQYCTMTGFKSYAGYLMEPVNYILGVITSTMGDISSAVDDIRGHIYSVRTGFMGIVGTIFGKLQNTMSEVVVLVSRIRDIISRLIGVVAVLAGTLTVATSTTQSILNGPVGQVAEFVCWDPETPIQKADGSTVPIREICMGDVLKSGGIVEGIMTFDASGVEMYNIDGVIVSGDHLVFDQGHWKMVKSVVRAKRIEYTKPYIHCLNTDTHEIMIKHLLFRDFEETSDRETIEKIQGVISNNLNIGHHRWVPKGITGSYESGFHRDTVIMTRNGRRLPHELTIGDVLVDGSTIKGILVYEGTAYVTLPGDIRVLPDTLIRIAINNEGNQHIWTRARYVAPTIVEAEPSIYVQFLTTSNTIQLMGSTGALTWIRDDNECNDRNILNYRTSLVLRKLNAV